MVDQIPDGPPNDGSGCSPGDVVVMPVQSGYLIGRVLSPSGPGRWWTYVDLAVTRAAAIAAARRLADEDTGRAWVLNDDGVYEAIPETPLPV